MDFNKKRLEEYKKQNPNELEDAQFYKIEKEMKQPDRKTISDEYFDFKLWCLGLPSRQESFAKYVTKKIFNKNAKKILEVGCGRTCRVSRILEQKGFEMTCIDPKIEEFGEQTKITMKKQKFDYTYDLSDYDYVIAQEPCEATEHIVRACVQQGKPFIMALCGVPHKLISGKKFKNVYDWYDYLINIDSNGIKLRYVYLGERLKTYILLKD